MLLLTSTLVLSALLRAPTSGLAVLESPHRHVRAETSAAHRALRDGYRRSVTFAALVDRLQCADIVVYVDLVTSLPDAVDGRSMMIPTATHVR
ncbi:MAG TPA: hypothetical protein VGL62_07030, partial [Vicinamibacterales bacterium]